MRVLYFESFLLCCGAAGIFRFEEGCTMNLSIDSAACVSCGMCAERLPALFRIDRAAHTAALIRRPAPTEEDDALEVAEDCPAGAIFFVEKT